MAFDPKAIDWTVGAPIDPTTGKPYAPTPEMLAADKAQQQPGGIPVGYYRANPDGTLTLLKDYGYGKAGDTVAANGAYVQPDGQPRLGPNGQPGFSTLTPSGAKATDNPNFYGQQDTLSSAVNTVGTILKSNPLGGQAVAGYDLVTGKPKTQVASDLVGGFTGGAAGVDANGNIVPGAIGGPVLDAAGNALGALGLGGSSAPIDTGIAKEERDRANALADALGVEREKAGAQADTDRGLGVQSRAAQDAAIGGLRDAAEGKVASAAELALTRQSGIDAARQQGLAAALQGNNPSAALRQASMGAAKVAGDTAANAAQLRANEQATARTALASAIQNQRQQDQGAVNTDVTQQGQAQTGQTTSQGQGVTMTAAELDARAKEKQAEAQKEGAEIGALGALGTGLLTKSDRRAKENVRSANLADAIGKEVHGVTFEYKPGEGDRDPHFGLMAQELERVIPGVVKKDAEGMRRVDTGQLTMGNTATLAELARRIEELESGGGRKKGRAA